MESIDGSHKCRDCSKTIHPHHGHALFDKDGEPIEGFGTMVLCPDCFKNDKTQQGKLLRNKSWNNLWIFKIIHNNLVDSLGYHDHISSNEQC